MDTAIVTYAAIGWLDVPQVQHMTAHLRKVAADCQHYIIDGSDMRYRTAEGLAALMTCMAETATTYPHLHIWLCHISPDIRSAATLAAIDADWQMYPDTGSVLDAITRQTVRPHSNIVPIFSWMNSAEENPV